MYQAGPGRALYQQRIHGRQQEVSHVHPEVRRQLTGYRQQERLAQAAQQRLARQLVVLAAASRRAERAEQRLRRVARRAALLLHSGLEN